MNNYILYIKDITSKINLQNFKYYSLITKNF